jgi:hypothetical protein
MKIPYVFVAALLSLNLSAQSANLRCIEKEKKNEDGKDPIITKTCFYKNFKFIITSFPDNVGRYVYSEHHVYVLSNGKYIKTTNDRFFNKQQKELVSLINKQINQDFADFKKDSTARDCLTEIDSIPVYKMNDFEISFEENEIWFEVHWGLSGACRAVDGTIVSFKFSEIKKYLN